jgi:hypothetical protein
MHACHPSIPGGPNKLFFLLHNLLARPCHSRSFLEFQSTFSSPCCTESTCRSLVLSCVCVCVCVSPPAWIAFYKSCEIHDHEVWSDWVSRNLCKFENFSCKWEFSVGNPFFVCWVYSTPGRALATGQPVWLLEANKASNQSCTRAQLAMVPNHHPPPPAGHKFCCSCVQTTVTITPILLDCLLLTV